MLGIFMHNIKDWSGQIDISGNNQFGELGKNPMGAAVYFWQIYPSYDWVNDSGYANLGDWIERAAKLAGK
jgi:hypothetical protein